MCFLGFPFALSPLIRTLNKVLSLDNEKKRAFFFCQMLISPYLCMKNVSTITISDRHPGLYL